MSAGDDPVAAAILAAARARGAGRTLCPSEVARALDPGGWRGLMPAVRAAAGRLAAQGVLAITRKGVPVAPDARGPVRLGLPPSAPSPSRAPRS